MTNGCLLLDKRANDIKLHHLLNLLRLLFVSEERNVNNIKLYNNWQHYINREYKLQSNQKEFDSRILNSNIDIQVTHDLIYNDLHI